MTIREQIEMLSAHLRPERYGKMLHALSHRTNKLAVVLEDIYQSHNAAAVMRSCDAFGLQKAFVIENRYPLNISHNVDMGTSKWMTVKKFKSPTCTRASEAKCRPPNEHDLDNTRKAMREIKAQGYTIAISTLREDSVDLKDLPVDKPLAIMIGTELTGLSEAAHEEADLAFKIDMLGFAQSFNLSVFAALCISTLANKMRALDDSWKMSATEQDELLLSWLTLNVNAARHILRGQKKED
jgi:tRNA (guanosine-2'-O-)-methyltransferase